MLLQIALLTGDFPTANFPYYQVNLFTRLQLTNPYPMIFLGLITNQ